MCTVNILLIIGGIVVVFIALMYGYYCGTCHPNKRCMNAVSDAIHDSDLNPVQKIKLFDAIAENLQNDKQ